MEWRRLSICIKPI